MLARVRRRFAVVAGAVTLSLSLSPTVLAQEVIRITTYRALFGKNAEISKVTDAEITGVYAGMKGLKWVKFYYDPVSGERGSVAVWENRDALDTYMKSEARRGILEKLRPLIDGDVTSRVFLVYSPGSSTPQASQTPGS